MRAGVEQVGTDDMHLRLHHIEPRSLAEGSMPAVTQITKR